MKKWLSIAALSAAVLFAQEQQAEAKVIWDGAEIVEGQNGKMTFKKDVKVYKRLPNGQFESLVVKQNNYFRVYNVEQYNGQTYYWMSSGYRVQATDLVIYKAIPDDVKAIVNPPKEAPIEIKPVETTPAPTPNEQPKEPVVEAPATSYYYVVSNMGGADFRTARSATSNITDTLEYGESFTAVAAQNGFIAKKFTKTVGNQTTEYTSYVSEQDVTKFDMASSVYTKTPYVVLTKDTQLVSNPLTKTAIDAYTFSTTHFDDKTVQTLPKGTVLYTNGQVIDNLLHVSQTANEMNSFVELSAIAALPKPTTQYVQYSLSLAPSWQTEQNSNGTTIVRNEAVQVYAVNDTVAFISYNGKYGFIPTNAIRTTKATVPAITATIAPAKDFTFDFGTIGAKTNVTFASTDGKTWAAKDRTFATYDETALTFSFRHESAATTTFTIKKPIKERSVIEPYGVVETIYSTYTTPAGTFNDVIVTDSGLYIAPGYGIIQDKSNSYMMPIISKPATTK